MQQRLFADRYWVNGGDLIEAVEFAGYSGLPSPSERAKKGRRLLATKPIDDYLTYLYRRSKAERLAQRKDEKIAEARAQAELRRDPMGVDQVNALIDTIAPCADPDISGDALKGAPMGSVGVSVEGSSAPDVSLHWRGAERERAPMELGSRQAGTLMPPVIQVEQSPYGRELCDREIREVLASIARGNEPGMKDARIRMRALELAMRERGMLVDRQLTATADLSPKNLTAEERDERIKRLTAFMEAAKSTKDVLEGGTEEPEEGAS